MTLLNFCLSRLVYIVYKCLLRSNIEEKQTKKLKSFQVLVLMLVGGQRTSVYKVLDKNQDKPAHYLLHTQRIYREDHGYLPYTAGFYGSEAAKLSRS